MMIDFAPLQHVIEKNNRRLRLRKTILPLLSSFFHCSSAYVYVTPPPPHSLVSTMNMPYGHKSADFTVKGEPLTRNSPSFLSLTMSSVRLVEMTKITSSPIQNSMLLLAILNNDDDNKFNVSNKSPPLEVRTQSQQTSDAMVLKSMRGTQWRIIEERTAGSTAGKRCRSLATFRGFEREDNKGVVNVDVQCRSVSTNVDNNDAITNESLSSSGRWVTKPSSIRRGSIQLSARWKVRLPDGVLIYKGFIEASKIMGKDGSPYDASMRGEILTGEKVNEEKVVGNFRGDFLKMLDDTEAKFVTDSVGGGPITLSPK